MASELMLPPYLYPSEVELELADTVGQFNPSFGFAVSQRVDYLASRWKGTLKFTKMTTSERHELLAFVHRAGRLNGFMTPVYGEAMRGVSSYFSELLNTANQLFVNSFTGWSTGGSGAGLVSGRIARNTRTVGSGDITLIQNTSVAGLVAASELNMPHIHRTLTYPGRGAAFFGLQMRQGIQGTESQYGTLSVSYGYYSNVFSPTSTSLTCQLRDNFTGSGQVGDYVETSFFSASRCGVVTTSGQTGSGLYSGGWPSSISNLLRAGDFFNVHMPNGVHLARLTAPLHTTSGGLGYLQFAPAVPEAVPSSAAIVPYFPLLKCVATAPPKVRTYPPGYISDVSIDVEGTY